MLYELVLNEESTESLRPLPFMDFADVEGLEKDLENLLADNLLDTLFEEAPLMPFFQERRRQAEADIYALNAHGDVVIFELKRDGAGADSVHQALRYTQNAGQWTYHELARRYAQYSSDDDDLSNDHYEAFRLRGRLDHTQFNRRQHQYIVGNAADTELIDAIEYWRSQNLNIHFVPYRIYEIGGKRYFEFFARPNDRHSNPKNRKGVLFDTNRKWHEDLLWTMIEKKRIAAYGEQSRFASYINQRDIVFYSHSGSGIVAAAKVIGETKREGPNERYHDVEFLTALPEKGQTIRAMPVSTVSEVTGKTFYWARTLKVPYLTYEDAEVLLEALKNELQ